MGGFCSSTEIVNDLQVVLYGNIWYNSTRFFDNLEEDLGAQDNYTITMKYAYFLKTGDDQVTLYDANDNVIGNPITVGVPLEGADVERELMLMGHTKDGSFESNTDEHQ